jgi:hypothetical protein
VAAQARRQTVTSPDPLGAPLSVFVPGHLRNPLNGSWGGWRKHARLAKDWRERTAQRVFLATYRVGAALGTPRTPKRVTFTACVGRRWDTDNLPAAIKPLRDALVDARVIHDDGPDAGHEFVYAQQLVRKFGAARGVGIVVELR